jgi:hypothetical protein
MMADNEHKEDSEVNPDAIEDLLEGDWKDDDEESEKMFGDEEEEV